MHKGIFKLSRLPFGLKIAQSLFQQIMDPLLAGMDYAIVYLHDILIKSENEDQHKLELYFRELRNTVSNWVLKNVSSS